jgi:aryl-alcohol dehydrogenase
VETTRSVHLLWLISYGHRIHGIIEGDSDLESFIPELIAHFNNGKFPFDRLIQTYPLTEMNQAVRDQAAGHCIKAVLIP